MLKGPNHWSMGTPSQLKEKDGKNSLKKHQSMKINNSSNNEK